MSSMYCLSPSHALPCSLSLRRDGDICRAGGRAGLTGRHVDKQSGVNKKPGDSAGRAGPPATQYRLRRRRSETDDDKGARSSTTSQLKNESTLDDAAENRFKECGSRSLAEIENGRGDSCRLADAITRGRDEYAPSRRPRATDCWKELTNWKGWLLLLEAGRG